MKPYPLILNIMKKTILTLLTITLMSAGFLYANWDARLDYEPIAQAASANAGAKVPGMYIVQIKNYANPQQVAARHGLSPRYIYNRAVKGFAGRIPAGILKRVQSDPNVLSVIQDRVVTTSAKPDKPGKPPKDGGGGSSGQVVPAGLVRIGAAPGSLSFTGSGVGVAIIDTGIDFAHTDLNVQPDCFFAKHSSSCQDDHGHGTHVSGIVAALDNSQDTVGVAPNAALYAVKVLDSSGSGYDSDIIAGLDWIATNAATVFPRIRVANISLGRPGTVGDNPVMQAAIQNVVSTGVTVVVAAGNDEFSEVSENIPAAYPEVLAIASTSAEDGTGPRRGGCAGIVIPADTASYFTTDGDGVAISAPGEARENVRNNCFINSEGILSLQNGGGTTRKSGTSMAAPHVAGVVALMVEKSGALTSEAIRTALKTGADNIGVAPLDSPTSSYSFDGLREGILSAPGALGAVQ